MAKTGESQTGSVSFLSYWRIIFKKFCDNLKEESTFKLYYISGDFLLLIPPFLFTVHIRPFSAHVRPVIQVAYYHAFSKQKV